MSRAGGPGHGQLDWLSPFDVSYLRTEDRGLPMHVAALALLGEAPPDGPAQLDLGTVRRAVARRLHLVPRLRQILYQPHRRPL